MIDVSPLVAFAFEALHEKRILAERARCAVFAEDYHRSPTQFQSRPVVVNGVRYDSPADASSATGIPQKTIRECCNGITRRYRDHAGKMIAFTAEYVFADQESGR